jgi:hypothetical protein
MSPNRTAGAYGGLGLDQVEDEDGTVTREQARAAWPAPNGELPKPKPVKLCVCGCGKPFEPSNNRQMYRPGCRKPGESGSKARAKPKTRAAAAGPVGRPEPAGVVGPAPAGPGGNQKAPPQTEVWQIVADLHRNIVGATIEVHVGDTKIVVRP